MLAMDVQPITWNVDSQDWRLDSYPASPGYPAVKPSMNEAQVQSSWAAEIAQSHPNGMASL